MNIAIINAADVGQSSFWHDVFDLHGDTTQTGKPNLYTVQGIQHAVTFSKTLMQDLRYTEDSQIRFSKALGSGNPSHIHAAIVIYEVSRPDGLVPLPKVLEALKQTGIPVLLVPSRSVQFASIRTRERDAIEDQAKALSDGIDVFHVADTQGDLQKRCVSVLLLRHVRGPRVQGVIPSRTPSVLVTRSGAEDITQLMGRNRTDSKLSIHSQTHPSLVNDPSHCTSRSSGSSFGSFHIPGKLGTVEHYNNTDPSSASSSHPSLPGCTLKELVFRLLSSPDSMGENNFGMTFLAVYRMFAAPSELLQCILSQYSSQQYVHGADALGASGGFTVEPCLFILERWMNTYPGDFAHPLTRQILSQFLVNIVPGRAGLTIGETLRTSLIAVQPNSDTEWANSDSKLENENAGHSKSSSESATPRLSMTLPSSISSFTPDPKRPLNDAQWRLFMIQDDDSTAQELVNISHSLFKALPLRDLLRHATPSIANLRNSNISPLAALTAHFNHIAHWTSNMLLLPSKSKSRSLTLAKIMRIARKVRQLNDYNTAAALVAGMQATSVHRLQQTWELVAPDQRKDFTSLEMLLSNARGCASYRLAWENTKQEEGHVPFLAVHQRDLVVAIAGGRTFVEDIPNNQQTEGQAQAGAQEPVKPQQYAQNTTFTPASTETSTANTSFADSFPTDAPSTANTSFSSESCSIAPSIPSYQAVPSPKPRIKRGLINWRKFEIIGTTLLTLQAAQKASYNSLRENATMRSMLLESIIEKDEEALYQRSCLLESNNNEGAGTAVAGQAVMEQAVGGVRRWVSRLGRGMSER